MPRYQNNIKGLCQDRRKKIHSDLRWNNNKMFSDSKKPEDVVIYIDKYADLITKYEELLSYKIGNVNVIRQVKNQSAADSSIQLIDLKLDAPGGPVEDEVYALNPMLVKNVRRGNTLLRLADGELSFGRKGLQKFFDLRYEFISPSQRYDDKCLSEEHHMQKNQILAKALKTILAGGKVEVLKTLKANGENVQVSWNQDTKTWVVCSKNVGLIAKQRQDINKYKGDRYGFAKEMAHVWFDKLEQYKKKDPKIVDELKKELSGNTLIGEYVGSDEHQHLVKYSRTTIIFYAIVNNHSAEECWPCEKSWAFFKKYNMDKVHIQSLGMFNDYDNLCNSLCKIFQDVAKSEIAKEEEGNVLYLLKKGENDANGAPDQVLSLTKLKTLEYRLFRKMREKLRNFHAKPREERTRAAEQASQSRFVREAKELLSEHDLPRPLEYYIQIFKTAFTFIKTDPERYIDELNNCYVTFSEHLLDYYEKKNAGSSSFANTKFFASDVLDIQEQIQYEGGFDAERIDVSKLDEERKENPDDYNEDSEVVEQTKQTEDEEVKDFEKQSPAHTKRQVIFLVPFCVPCCGKSFLWKTIQKKFKADGWTFACVSSDELRMVEMQKYLQKNKNADKDKAFDATKKSGPKAFSDRLRNLVKNSNNSENGHTHVIFVDKNHPPNGMKNTLNDIFDCIPADTDFKVCYMVPDMTGQELADGYPLSEQFMLTCFHRLQHRTDHATLNNDDPVKAAQIQFMFLKMLEGYNFDQKLIVQNHLDCYFKAKMANDKINKGSFSKELINLLNDVIDSFKNGMPQNTKLVQKFLDELKKHEKLFNEELSEDEVIKSFQNSMKQILGQRKVAKSQSNGKQNQNGNQQAHSNGKQQQQQQPKQQKQKEPQKQKQVNKFPVFQGISCEQQVGKKLIELFTGAFKQANESAKLIKTFEDIISNWQGEGGWVMPNSYHVTSLFIGGNKNQMKTPAYEYFQEGKKVDVTIRAVVYIPGQLVTGITFPRFEIENEFPHLTLMCSNKYKPVMSNALIKETCAEGGCFHEDYLDAKEELLPEKDDDGVSRASNIIINGKNSNKEKVVFVLLKKPVTFKGVAKNYY